MKIYNKHGNKTITCQYIIAKIKLYLILNKTLRWIICCLFLIFIFFWIMWNIDVLINTLMTRSNHKWTHFGEYYGLPNFYIKKGMKSEVTLSHLLTLATFCDVTLLDDAREIAINYQSGPISIAVYIDEDYAMYDRSIYYLFDDIFSNVRNKYDIIIGLLYYNKWSRFYISKGFIRQTPMMFKIPNNALRNLAEYQVTTTWLFNVDIDFIHFAYPFSNKLEMTLQILNDMTLNSNIGPKTIFIVPSFEVNQDFIDPDTNNNQYNALNKEQLLNYINKGEIIPFHQEMQAQKCTNYKKWYETDENELYYLLDYKYGNMPNCSWHYEPWYIIKSEISKNEQYSWDTSFVGRGLNKVERTMTLRHYCFNLFVLNDLFIIHKSKSLHWDGIPSIDHNKITSNDTKEWHSQNFKLFEKKRNRYYLDPNSCSFYSKTDKK